MRASRAGPWRPCDRIHAREHDRRECRGVPRSPPLPALALAGRTGRRPRRQCRPEPPTAGIAAARLELRAAPRPAAAGRRDRLVAAARAPSIERIRTIPFRRFDAGRSSPAWSRSLIALQSGIERYDTTLFSIHMVQHLLLTLVAPPLLALGAPVTQLMRAASPGTRSRWILPLLHSRLDAGRCRIPSSPELVFIGGHVGDALLTALRPVARGPARPRPRARALPRGGPPVLVAGGRPGPGAVPDGLPGPASLPLPPDAPELVPGDGRSCSRARRSTRTTRHSGRRTGSTPSRTSVSRPA